jgi:hypothetical protein
MLLIRAPYSFSSIDLLLPSSFNNEVLSLENSGAKEENGKHCKKHIGCIGVNMADMHLAREICE